MKRAIDLLASALGLIFLSPLLLLIALLVKLDSRGPVFYRGSRVGLRGAPFHIFKFRTMVEDAERRGGPSTAGDDPRITRVGGLLRKHKLDELPQLLNVLRGEMSLVGPRPEVKRYVDLFTEEERAILGVRPGITDLASLWNRDEGEVLRGSADPERDYLERIRPVKVRLQLEYVEKRSLLLDLRILAATVLCVVLRPRPGMKAPVTPGLSTGPRA